MTAGIPRVADWHAQTPDSVRTTLATPDTGLTAADAAGRPEHHGPNRLPPPKTVGPWKRFLRQFDNVLIYVLLASAATTAALGHPVDTAVILGVVLINAIIGFVQEGRAESALAAIRDLLSLRACVLRDG